METKENQDRWDKLTPEQRESVEHIRARKSTPEHLAEVAAAQEQIRKEFPPASAGYLAQIAAFPLRPIRSDEELAAATKFLEALGKRPALEDDEEDYCSVLSDLIIAYEAEHHARPRSSPQEMLRYLFESRSVSPSEVSRATGIGVSAIVAIRGGKQIASMDQVGRLATYFNISPKVFIERGAGEREPD